MRDMGGGTNATRVIDIGLADHADLLLSGSPGLTILNAANDLMQEAARIVEHNFRTVLSNLERHGYPEILEELFSGALGKASIAPGYIKFHVVRAQHPYPGTRDAVSFLIFATEVFGSDCPNPAEHCAKVFRGCKALGDNMFIGPYEYGDYRRRIDPFIMQYAGSDEEG